MEQFKKHFAYAMLLIVALLSATACSSGVDGVMDPSTTISEAETPEIILELQNFNANLEPSDLSRGGIGWMGWLTVVMRDGTGAYHGGRGGAAIGSIFGPHGATAGAIIGGAILGAVQSYEQYHLVDWIANASTNSIQSDKPTKAMFIAAYSSSKVTASNVDFLQYATATIDTCAIKVGFMHNTILEKIQSKNHGNFDDDYSSNLSEVESYVVSSPAFTTLYEEAKAAVTSTSSVKVNEKTLSDEIMNLFLDAVSSSCTTQNDLNRIIAYYATMVDKSTALNEVDKLSLKSGFTVTGYSFSYWSKKWPYKE